MSYGSNNFRPTRGSWGPGQGYGANVPNNLAWNYMDGFPQPPPSWATPPANRGPGQGYGASVPNNPPGNLGPGPGYGAYVPNNPPGNLRPGQGYGAYAPNNPPGNLRPGQGYGAYIPNNPPGNLRPGQGYGASVPNNMAWNHTETFPGPLDASEVAQGLRWASFQEELLDLPSFPAPPHSPMRLLVLDNDMARDANPRPRQSILDSNSRWNLQVPTQEESSRLTQDEQKQALKKLKKETYYPAPKSLARRLCLYYRDNGINSSSNSTKKENERDDEDGKRCAICLDDFEPGEAVMLTPCSHMFHEECIVPWVKSHGQCPVCRFTICERIRERASNNTTTANLPAGDLFAGDLISIIRAMDEALELGDRTRYTPAINIRIMR